MTRDEINLLLYFETSAVDGSGLITGSKINADDDTIARRWNVEGYVQYGRLKIAEFRRLNRGRISGIGTRTHVVRLSGPAWQDAARFRRERAERGCKPIDEYELCGT